jgi:hypothetical protein
MPNASDIGNELPLTTHVTALFELLYNTVPYSAVPGGYDSLFLVMIKIARHNVKILHEVIMAKFP